MIHYQLVVLRIASGAGEVQTRYRYLLASFLAVGPNGYLTRKYDVTDTSYDLFSGN